MPERLLSQKGTNTALDFTYSYNARGLVSDMIDGVDADNNREYDYDGQGRLTAATGPWDFGGDDGDAVFKYDALGNMLEKTLGARTIALTYDTTKNRVTQSADTGETGTRTLAYDTRGNVKSIGGLNMDYDASDRPTGLSGAATGSYRYDGHGRRIKSITVHDDDTKTTRYNVYDAGGSLVYVVQLNADASKRHVTNYIKLDGQTIARVKSTGSRTNYSDEITWLHHDHLGSAVAGTDDNGAVAWTESYTPYGISLVNNASNDNQAGFTGHIKDSDTGLTYMQARYYDPVVSRFLSHDPIEFTVESPLMFNRYSYTEGNPINATDPFGLEKVEVTRRVRDSNSLGKNGSRIGDMKSFTVEAGNLEESEVNDFASGLSDETFTQLDGQDLSGFSADTITYNSSADHFSNTHNQKQNLLNVANQIGSGLMPPSDEFPAADVVAYWINKEPGMYGNHIRRSIGRDYRRMRDVNLITGEALGKGINFVVATSIHERGHQGGVGSGINRAHGGLYSAVNAVMTGVNAPDGSWYRGCKYPGAC